MVATPTTNRYMTPNLSLFFLLFSQPFPSYQTQTVKTFSKPSKAWKFLYHQLVLKKVGERHRLYIYIVTFSSEKFKVFLSLFIWVLPNLTCWVDGPVEKPSLSRRCQPRSDRHEKLFSSSPKSPICWLSFGLWLSHI